MSDFIRLEEGTTREERIRLYIKFCEKVYVPVFSQPWWMDTVCNENWDVWLYNPSNNNVLAAMPYYFEKRGKYHYITKALLTQTNGIHFSYNPKAKPVAIAEFQERVIKAACLFIDSMNLDVYEQQFHHTFQNWQPFYWNHYTNILRYTYIIEDTSDPKRVLDRFSANYRNIVRKGEKITSVAKDLSPERFYIEHKKIYDKQSAEVPFTSEFWLRLYNECDAHEAGKILFAKDSLGNIHSVIFVVWDMKAMYLLLGGPMPEFSSSQSFSVLTYASICMAGEKGLIFDFEGSMIQRVVGNLGPVEPPVRRWLSHRSGGN